MSALYTFLASYKNASKKQVTKQVLKTKQTDEDVEQSITENGDVPKKAMLSHTRIPSKEHNVYGGAYSVPSDKMDDFFRAYYQHVFVEKRPEHLTETRTNDGPLLIDLDFRYPATVRERQHTEDDVESFIGVYLDELSLIYDFTQLKEPLDVYVMERPNVVCESNVTKDGIHFLFGIKMSFQLQTLLRERILSQIHTVLDLPITNSWSKVLDEGISTGVTNWTVYGSRKPGKDPYLVTAHYRYRYDQADGSFEVEKIDPNNAVRGWNDLWKLSAKNETWVGLPLVPSMEAQMKSIAMANRHQTSCTVANALLASVSNSAKHDNHADEDDEEDYGDDGEDDGEDMSEPSCAVSVRCNARPPLVPKGTQLVVVPATPAPAPPAPTQAAPVKTSSLVSSTLFSNAIRQFNNVNRFIQSIANSENATAGDDNASVASEDRDTRTANKVVASAIHPAFYESPPSASSGSGAGPMANSLLLSRTAPPPTQTHTAPSMEVPDEDDLTVMDDQTILTEAHSEIRIDNITNQSALDRAIAILMDNLDLSREMYIRETHEYTQILPPEYYEPGSHLKNRMVAFALKHTDERLFLSWIKLRSKASDFDYSTIPKLYQDWQLYYGNNGNARPLTRRSIMYWAKQGAPEEYAKLQRQSMDTYVNIAILSGTDWDVANVVRQICADRYVCADNRPKTRTWYVYRNHRWELDKGQSLRRVLSEEVHMLFYEKSVEEMQRLNEVQDDDVRAKIKQRLDAITRIKKMLKSSSNKNNFMCEAAELMFDGEIEEKMDENPYLMGFLNGVVDFKNKEFRAGHPNDYISKSTMVKYYTQEEINNTPEYAEIKAKIMEFMSQVYPDPQLLEYMLNHFASVIIGVKMNQDFTVLIGSGSNGKSAMIDLFRQGLGQYFMMIPIRLLTGGGRVNVGAHSDEIAKLKGVRYAPCQESKKGMVFDEGVMKDLTGGSMLTARGIFKESISFMPQFTMDIATNELPVWNTNDDGTWRRIRRVDHESKFVDPGEKYSDKPKYVFPKNKELTQQFPIWAPIFISMLVHRAFETNGLVTVCPRVMEASNEYRRKQDCLMTYMDECIEHTESQTDKMTITGMYAAFKEWYKNNWGDVKMLPKRDEVRQKLVDVLGAPNSRGHWVGYVAKISPDQMCDDDDTVGGSSILRNGDGDGDAGTFVGNGRCAIAIPK